ncbi:MAG: amidohydrolase family protein [Chloroflexi bacterium]|nr:amidohydrolase family protein [Chloroflexota bacterium]
MDIIDFRLRPPTHGFLDLYIYTAERVTWFAQRLGVEPSPAALSRSLDQFWAEMDAAGIGRGVVIASHSPRPFGSVTNEDIADLQRRYPDRFIGIGAVRAGRPSTLRELDRAVRELGLRGISTDPGLHGVSDEDSAGDVPKYPSDPAICEVAWRCALLGVPLLLTLSILAGPDLSYVHPLHVDRLAAACPETKIVVAHACWPYAQEMCGVAFRRPNVFISPDMYMMRCPGVPDFVRAANTFLADRFLFGSAYPSCPLKPLLDYYAELPIDDHVRPKIMHENAARLLGIA